MDLQFARTLGESPSRNFVRASALTRSEIAPLARCVGRAWILAVYEHAERVSTIKGQGKRFSLCGRPRYSRNRSSTYESRHYRLPESRRFRKSSRVPL